MSEYQKEMNDALLIDAELVKESENLWIVLTGNNLDEQGLFRSMEDALGFVERALARNIAYRIDLKDDGDDDISELPNGVITALNWSAPSRRMTKQEVRQHPNKMFTEAWLKNPPMMSDLVAAKKTGVQFIDYEYTHISIDRVSRYIGYIHRSGQLNDKRREVAALNALYTDLL